MRNSNISLEGRGWNRLAFCCAFAALVSVYVAMKMYALDRTRMMSEYMREHWSTERGFPRGTVSAIAQTADGYLWIGTDRGLIRFDGLDFRSFPQATPMPLTIGPVKALVTDLEGNLWILLQNTKILRYHQGSFELGRDEAEDGITAIGTRADGGVLFSSLAYGALTYGKGKFEILQFPAGAPAGSAAAVANSGNDTLSSHLAWATSVAAHRLAEPNTAVVSVAQTTDGKVWLGTRDKGLFYLADGHVFAAGKQWLRGAITSLLPLNNGKMWIATGTGVVAWNGKELSEADVPSPLRQAEVLAMLRDRDSNTWLGTTRGLLRFNANGVSSLTETRAAGGPVTALFEDREGNLWAGSPQGLERLRDGAFVTYTVGSLQSESSGPIYVSQDGRVWFAPFEGGLHWLKEDKSGSVTNDGLSQDVVYSITGTKNDLWVGRQRGGLTHLGYHGGSMSIKTYTHAEGLPENGVYAVYRSRDGSIWAATLSSGVSKYQNGHFVTYSKKSGMISDTVTSVAESPDGTMWFATPVGLNALSNNQWRAFSVRDGLPSDNINCLLSDSAGVLWIGTVSGLALLRSGRIESLLDAPPPFREPIMGIAEGRKDRLWIATANHVFCARRDKLLSGSLGDTDLRVYGLEDGLAGTEGVKRERSVFEDDAGRVWFSMNRGLSVVDTERAIDNSPPAIVRIEGLSVDGNAMDLQRPVRVPPGSHRVTVSYSGLSLSVPQRMRFRYKLEGFDQHWSEPVSTREAVYTNLDSGSYRFRLIASNSDGLWNTAESALPIEIEPVFWKTWWFRLSTALLIGLSLLLCFRLRMLILARQMNLRFEERLAERTRIARELHDSLLQGFQGLMFRLQAVRDLLPERPTEAAQALDTALDRGDQVIAEGRSTVEDLRDSTLQDTNILQALASLGEELAGSNNGLGSAPLRVLVEGPQRDLDPILRDEVYRIAREALRNAFQHSHARTIEAEVTYSDAQFSLRVRDDGNGIDPKVFEEGRRSGHWGLPGMRERATALGGQLHVWSESGAGTEIELTIPGSIAYVDSSSHSGLRSLISNFRGNDGRRS